MGNRGTRRTAAAVILAVLSVACGGEGEGTDGGLTGTITISGSSTVQPISGLVAELFNEDVGPGVAISVDGPGTSDGFVLFCDGETDVQDASRAIEQEEIDACAANGVEFVELAVAFDGITVMTNPANRDVSCLNNADLYGLFGPESEGIDTWAGANDLATAVGGNGGLPDVPLEITAPGEESGTYDAFIDLAGIEDLAIANGVPETEAGALRTDYQASADDNVIIAAVEGADTALGFVGYAFAEGAGEGVKLLEVDGGSGCVAPSRDTIADGSYPLSRTLYIYVNVGRAAESPALTAYVDYYMTGSALVEAVTAVGYVVLPADQVDATRAAWAAAST